GFVAPLVVWLIFKDRSQRLNDQGKEALNFQLTLLLAYVVGSVLTIILIGGLILFAAWVCAIIFAILGAMAASRDELYRYPFKITFIKRRGSRRPAACRRAPGSGGQLPHHGV